MREITQERRKLTEIYFSLKERLDDLNKLEQKGLSELSLKGYLDLYNLREKEVAVTNVERETKHVIDKLNKESEVPDKIDKQNVEVEKDKYYKQTTTKTKRSPYLHTDKIIGFIASVLKESPVPIGAKDIHKHVEERMEMEIGINNFRNNIMPRAIKKNKNIQRASHGFYQYVN